MTGPPIDPVPQYPLSINSVILSEVWRALCAKCSRRTCIFLLVILSGAKRSRRTCGCFYFFSTQFFVLLKSISLKGTGFSPYIKSAEKMWALAPEGN
jgi:hypothetical protein